MIAPAPPTETLLCGDSLAHLRAMPTASVDLVFTSPPYEDARTYGIGFKTRGEEWVRWSLVRYLECLRVSRGLVAWVVAGKTKDYQWSATPALLMADLHRAGVCLRNPPIFYRHGIPGSGGPDWLASKYEVIVCATARRGRLPWSDVTAMGHAPRWARGGAMSNRLSDGTRRDEWGGTATSGNHRKPSGERDAKGRPSRVLRTMRVAAGKGPTGEQLPNRSVPFPKIANPGNVIKCQVGGGRLGSKHAHRNEAPFPEALAEFFIRSFCPPGGTALDPFCGSGTTLAVAKKHGRSSIGIDIRKSQITITRERLVEIGVGG